MVIYVEVWLNMVLQLVIITHYSEYLFSYNSLKWIFKGNYNDDGISIFNHPVATKQLMFKLLDILNKELPCVEAEFCLECN